MCEFTFQSILFGSNRILRGSVARSLQAVLDLIETQAIVPIGISDFEVISAFTIIKTRHSRYQILMDIDVSIIH